MKPSLKTTVLAAGLLAASVVGARAQETPPDAAWKTRLSSLQEEYNTQTGTALFIVFDDSGSMRDDNKLVMAKKAFRAWIEHAPADYRFSLTAINAGSLVPLARNNRKEVLAAVDRLRASGETPLADTIARIHDTVTRYGGAVEHIHETGLRYRASGALYVRQVVVILTDGEDTTKRGDQGVRDEMERLRREGVEVVAFGYKGEADYLNGSATHFYSPNNGQDISQGLDAIQAEVRDTSDLLVDDTTRRAMGVLPVTASMQSAPVVATAVATPEPTPAARKKSGGLSLGTLIVLIGVVVILRGLLGGKKRR